MVPSNRRSASSLTHTATSNRLSKLIAELLPILGVVPAALHMPLPTSAGIEDMASSPSDIRRSIYCKGSAIGQVGDETTPTVEGDSEVAAGVGHSVDSKVIGHVGNRILFVDLLRYDLHGLVLIFLAGVLVSSLRQVPSENLHQAMSVAVVVDGASLARRPDEHKLGLALVAWASEAGSAWGYLRDCSSHSLHRPGSWYSSSPCRRRSMFSIPYRPGHILPSGG